MASGKKKRRYTRYILPLLFGGLFITLAVLKGRSGDQPLKAVLREAEPLALTDRAVENYLFSAGFTLDGERVLDGAGALAATLTLEPDADGSIEAMTLAFPLPTYYETEEGGEALIALKANHDEAAHRGEELFLALFDAIAATDGRTGSRRDSALEKLRKVMDGGKASTQNANSWQFTFTPEPGLLEGTVTVRFEKVK